MITIYTPLSEADTKSIIHNSIIDFSNIIILTKILTGRSFRDAIIASIQALIQIDPIIYSMGLIIYTTTTPSLITAIDFSEFGWINRVKYISYDPANPPKLIKNLQTSIQQNPR